jgi:hypothetical protein
MRLLAVALIALLAAACATVPRYDAATDIHRFLVAIRDGDRATFENHVDRPALTAQLRSRVLAEAARSGQGGQTMQALSMLLGAPFAGVAADLLVQPEVFRAVAELQGYRPDMPVPSPLAITRAVRPIGGGSACVVARADGPCVLVFANQAGTWRLVGFEGDVDLLRPRR